MTEQPPVSSQAPAKKSKRNLIIAVVVILAVVLAVGIYLGTSGFGNNNSTTPTASPTPGGTNEPTTSPSGSSSNVSSATSLQYSVTGTDSTGKSLGSYTFYAKNAGSSNMAIRVEYTDPTSGDQMIYIVNGATKQAWVSTNGEWVDLSSTYQSQWTSWENVFKGYSTSLEAWTGMGDYHYTAPDGTSITISNVQINPNLADSLFTHS